MSAEITAGDTEAGHTFVLRNLAEVGSQGAIAGVIGIVAPAGTTVSKATTSSTDANPLTDGMSDLTGAVDYTISGLTPGGSIRMTFALPDGATPTNVYKLIGDTYVDVTAAATFNGQLVTLKITDGALGDTDGVVNGGDRGSRRRGAQPPQGSGHPQCPQRGRTPRSTSRSACRLREARAQDASPTSR